jgi:hypothetical protein
LELIQYITVRFAVFSPFLGCPSIAKVRHHGMTFMLTTQHPQNMSAYVRRLVDQHVHTVNKFGTSIVQRYTWGRCMDDPEKRSVQKSGTEDVGTLPKEVFDLYKSSSLHTRKRRIPRKFWIMVACFAVSIAAIVMVPVVLKRAADSNKVAISGSPAGSSDSQAKPVTDERKRVDEGLRVTDYPKWLAPRVEGQPWTAPAFDGLQVQAQPRIYCVANEDGGCHCRTEQGTKYTVTADMCRVMVQEGGVYNPFQPPQDRTQEQREERPSTAASSPSTGALALVGPSSKGWKVGAGNPVYIPPEQTAVGAVGAN